MTYTTVLLLGIMFGVWALVWELATGLRGLNNRLDRLAERLEKSNK